jgi:hypothetical protein
VDDWIESNPRGLGINWTCPMEVAVRACNWIATLALLRHAPELDDAFVLRLSRALWVHGRHLRRHPEIGRGGLTTNHYIADLVGLLAIGCALPELHEAAAWRESALGGLVRQMEIQVGEDGASFERSIPYHRLVSELFLHAALLARGAGKPLPDAFRARLARMLEFVAATTRPDGSVPQWGDGDDGRLLPLEGYPLEERADPRHVLGLGGALLDRRDLLAAAAGREVEALWHLGPRGRDADAPPAAHAAGRGFPDVGYYVLGAADLHAGVSCGPVGTRGLGSHTHGDLLAVCVWADGIEWITDPGTGRYAGDPALRNRLRATAAHATAQIGALEPNPFGAGIDDLFRMEPRARARVECWEACGARARLAAATDLSGAGWHTRTIAFDAASRAWRVEDVVLRPGASEAPAQALRIRFPLGPGVSGTIVHDLHAWPAGLGERLARGPGEPPPRSRLACGLRGPRERAFWIGLDLPSGARTTIEGGVHSPRYGVTQPIAVLVVTLAAAPRSAVTSVLWSPGAVAAR